MIYLGSMSFHRYKREREYLLKDVKSRVRKNYADKNDYHPINELLNSISDI